jgi:hypothetical protein
MKLMWQFRLPMFVLPKFVFQDPKSNTWIVETQSLCTLCHLLVTNKGIATSHPNSTLFPKPSSLKSFKLNDNWKRLCLMSDVYDYIRTTKVCFNNT